ncbi:MAG: carboxyl transferase domain-containing protein, partial [Myxococcota bacterium]|nr:carboxyl transferase domain-containing protein [Myxococcota bacterium]
MRSLVDELAARRDTVRQGGRGVARQRELGKLPVRERLDLVLDPGTPFLEVGGLAAWEMYEGAAPAAGMVAGVGMISGTECLIVANDASVKGG